MAPTSVIINIYSELTNRENYEQVIAAFRKKAQERPSRLLSRPVVPDINLRWLISESDYVIDQVIHSLKDKSYRPLPATINRIKFDKWRELSSLSWPDRLVESVLARQVTKAIDGHLSPRLYSFRKGFGNIQAVREFAGFVRDADVAGQPLFISRRDVKSYGDSIRRPILFKQLRELLGAQESYVYGLLETFLAAAPQESDPDAGIPTGFALTPACENVYLAKLDGKLAGYDDLFYIRFGDDIILSSRDEQVMQGALEVLQQHLEGLGLTSNIAKELDVAFRAGTSRFERCMQIEYLGFSVKQDGAIFLSKKKKVLLQNELRRICRQAFLSFRRLGRSKKECVSPLVGCIKNLFEDELRHPYFSYLLSTINDTDELKKLDTWIAKLPLAQVYGNTHDRVFRYCSRKKLHEMGMPSIQKLRIEALRGRRG